MVVSNINDITIETTDEAIANEDLDNLILNAIKSIRNIKKRPDCSVIYDYLIKLLPNSEINKERISNRLEYLTNNNTLKNKPNNGKDSYFIVNETDQNMARLQCSGSHDKTSFFLTSFWWKLEYHKT